MGSQTFLMELLKVHCFFLLLPLIIFSCQQSQEAPSFKISDETKLDDIIDDYVAEDYYPFIYARIEHVDGSLLYEHSAVNQKLLPDTKVDGNTLIRIWSMSKIVTISIVLDLIEDGILNLEDPVEKFIPEFKNLEVAISREGKSLLDYEWGNRDKTCPVQLVPNDSIMTVLHLINHQAGFYYATTGYPCLDSLVANQNLTEAINSNDLIQRLSKLPLVQHSGTSYFYGLNTSVLGVIAERVTSLSLDNLVEQRMTSPMNIDGLKYKLSSHEKLLPAYTGRDSVLRLAKPGELDIFGRDVPDYNKGHELYLGGEGMIGTADAYADFVSMLLNKGTLNGFRFLEEETVEEIHAPHTQTDNPYGYNGYNLWVSGDSMRIKQQGEAGLWIGGGYECTHFWADPNRNFVGIIMSQNNEVRAPGYDMNDKFRGELYKQLRTNNN